ncbi:MAG: hypothetical protein ACYCTF_09560 [Acidiferrobacter sp.]
MMRCSPLRCLAILLAVFVASFTAHADCEPAHIARALGIEEAWIENAASFSLQGRNTLAAGADLALDRHIGMEIDLPAWDIASHALSPAVGAGVKVVLHGPCQPQTSATYVTAELEGQYNTRARPAPPGQGDVITGQLEWAVVRPAGFFQGELGHNVALGAGGLPGWFLNASLGRRFGLLTLQWEFEIDNTLPKGPYGTIEGSVWPQLALHLTPSWLLALGEERTFTRVPATPRYSTWLLLEREFD